MTNADKQTATWTVDMKKTGTVYKGNAKPKADVTIILSDETLQDLATGKVRSCYHAGRAYADGGIADERPEGLHDGEAQDEG